MMRAWTELLPLFLIRAVTKRTSERIPVAGLGEAAEVRPGIVVVLRDRRHRWLIDNVGGYIGTDILVCARCGHGHDTTQQGPAPLLGCTGERK